MSKLIVLVKSATNLKNKEFSGTSDPFVEVEYKKHKEQTSHKDNTLNPEWNETVSLDLGDTPVDASASVTLRVMDYEKVMPNKFMAQIEVPLSSIVNSKSGVSMSELLKNKKGRDTMSKLDFTITYQQPEKSAAGGQVAPVQPDLASSEAAPLGEPACSPALPGAPGSGGTSSESGLIATGTASESGLALKALQAKYSTKPQDWQIRVKVLKGRQLQGSDISPLVKVTCAGDVKQTHVKHSSKSPVYNEMFYFNFHKSQAELLGQSLEFSVYDSRRLRRDAFLASFSIDLALIYEAKRHSLLNKWMLMGDPNDIAAGAKGYIKMSCSIVGPGDDPPSMKSIEGDDDDSEIEANLLRPAGLQLRPAVFRIRVFMAEDLPQMDSATLEKMKFWKKRDNDQKQYVDPFLKISFAGKEMKTSTKYETDHPEWNEEFVLNYQFPSVCDSIKFTLYDWDSISASDPTGSAKLDLNEIGWTDDNGFLPTYGPSYLNFYGSPRKYQTFGDKYEKLNLGKGPGIAYRGRVLIQISTELLDDALTDEVLPIDADEIARVQKALHRRRFRLTTGFLAANMIPGEESDPVSFEVSSGCFGNSEDRECPPSPSATPPSNPIYDGNHFSFLPWGDDKPCSVVTCQWEDISYRMFAANMFDMASNQLGEIIENLDLGIRASMNNIELINDAVSDIQRFLAIFNKPIPEWVTGQSPETELDKNYRRLRNATVISIKESMSEFLFGSHGTDEILTLLKQTKAQLERMVAEPQNSMPDIIITMIVGDKRHAVARLKPREIIFSEEDEFRGTYWGQPRTIKLQLPRLDNEDPEKFWKIPCQLRVVMMLTLEQNARHPPSSFNEASLVTLAETYENQVSVIGSWKTTKMLMGRPEWSDIEGNMDLRKEWFNPPRGMKWDGDWFVAPESSLIIKEDVAQNSFIESLFQNESRSPTTQWVPANPHYSDVENDELPAPEKTTLPQGWSWEGDWEVDNCRQCDDQGFEYAVNFSDGSFVGTERLHHMFRRKRWIRKRVLGEAGLAIKKQIAGHILGHQEDKIALLDSITSDEDAGWTYALGFSSRFHPVEKKSDSVRRKRWHRKLIASGKGPAQDMLMQISGQDEEKSSSKKKENLAVPRIVLQFNTIHTWQLSVHIYQARNILAADKSGLSDPYLLVAFEGMSQRTYTSQQTVAPMWDQTLIFRDVQMCGQPDQVRMSPPEIILELFDEDKIGKDEFLGRCIITPRQDDESQPSLFWYKFYRYGKEVGDVLAAYDLVCLDGNDPPIPPPKRGDVYIVPEKIRPVMQRTAVEILCWGVRDMAKYKLSSVDSPSVDFEIGGHSVSSEVIRHIKNNPNFPNPLLYLEAYLPEDPHFMPPLNISVVDHRAFGMKPRVGMDAVIDLLKYTYPMLTEPLDPSKEVKALETEPLKSLPLITSMHELRTAVTPEEQRQLEKKIKFSEPTQEDQDFDWWSKFHASLGEWNKCLHYKESGYDTLIVYQNALEDVPKYGEFTDFADTFVVNRGKNLDDDDKDNYAGQLKATFRMYALPEDPNAPPPPRYFEHLSVSSKPQECIVRIYIVRARQLQPKDRSGLSDPFIEVELGRQKVNTKDHYIPNTLDPDFGTMLEVKCTIPIDKDLKIRVMDYDRVGSNELIGQTTVDLENRYLSKYRATCGLPQSYCTSGLNQWRDSKLPSEILKEICAADHRPPPAIQEPANDTASYVCRIGAQQFRLDQLEKGVMGNEHLGPPAERLCLHVLNRMDLIREHVETRTLYSPLQPEISQGSLQMWVDIFPTERGQPGPAFNIAPRKPEEFILRIVVWHTEECELKDKNLFGEKMSDLFVKGWLPGIDERQKTDVHYRSMNGEGLFNWRFVFPFGYLPAENTIVVKKKENFWSLDPTVLKVKPTLILQVWDNDLLKPNTFIGTLELNLTRIPCPAKWARTCNLDILNSSDFGRKPLNLFEAKRTKGYWPFVNDVDNTPTLTGKLFMEMSLLNESEAKEFPAGQGQEEPNENPHLEPPKRPATSFFWLTSPFKSLKHIFWPRFKKFIIIFLVVVLLGLLIGLFIYAIPQLLARKMMSV